MISKNNNVLNGKAQHPIIRKLLTLLHNDIIKHTSGQSKNKKQKPHTEVNFKHYLKRLLFADWREKVS